MGFPTRFRKLSVCLLVTLLTTTTLWAQTVIQKQLPDTVWIKVTFFDFHSDGSNPEFECDHSGGVYPNMAAVTLPANKQPAIGTQPYINRYFKYWYVGWDSTASGGAKGDYTIPKYTTSTEPGSVPPWNAIVNFDGSIAVDHDTAFINVVIEDSLPFILVDSLRGLYRFEDATFFPLDNRGFGFENRKHNYSFTMSLHTEFTYGSGLEFTFRGDDDVWTYVNNILVLDLGGIHNAETDVITANDLRSLNLTPGSTYDLDFYYAERHTEDSRIMIETNLIQPVLILDLSAEPDIIVPAGTIVTLKSEVNSKDSIPVPYPELSALTKWRVISTIDHFPSDLNTDSGAIALFTTHTPYDTIEIEGSVNIEGAGVLYDTIKIIVTPGPPCAVSIEPVVVTLASERAILQHPNPIDTIYIYDKTDECDAYAVVRDCSGAFIRMASVDSTEWSTVENIISVEGEAGLKYHGIIKRFGPLSTGTTIAIAKEGVLIPDSVPVVLSDGYPVRLRLVEKGHSVINDYITQIEIYTDSSESYEVYALISTATNPDDPVSWKKLNVDWDLTPPLDSAVSPPPPDFSEKWTFNPVKPGTGTLTLTNPEDTRTEVLVIPVNVILSPASRVAIRIITPEIERIAGKPIKALVIISNLDGEVPGLYCYGDGNPEQDQVSYSDILPRGGDRRPDPVMTVDGVTKILNTENDTIYQHNQCFMNGIDTVEFVLYYAPRDNDSLHQITVVINPDVKASSQRFPLLAASLDHLVLTHDLDGKDPISDTIRLTALNSKTVFAQGYDEHGNYRGPENSLWNTDGQLPPVDSPATIEHYYTIFHSNPVEQIIGNLCASAANSETGTIVSACAPVLETGREASIMAALTRDINGNGFLDRIDLTFSKKIGLSNIDTSNFILLWSLTRFPVDSIVPLIGDSVYALYLKEQVTTSPQTDWKPYLSMANIEGALSENSKVVDDGAAPVIWSVTKKMPSSSRKDDIVTIVLSEEIQGNNNSPFNSQNLPDFVFWVYYINSTGDFTKVDLFKGAEIIEFDRVKTIKIVMSNGLDINNSNWVNIRHENELIQDLHSNKPDSMNKKVNVVVEPVDPTIVFGPNPFPPGNHVGPGKIILRHDKDAFEKVHTGGGTVLVVTLPLPNDGSKVYLSLKVSDVAGNLANYSEKTDVIEDLKSQGYDPTLMQVSQFTLKYLWPGTSRKGMKLAPGIYKGVVTIDYTSPSFHDKRIVEFLGVGK